jgi:hypothetical protein
MQHKKREWVARGHGEYRELAEREFFAEMKGEERMVVHFYRESLPCAAMHAHLEALAASHVETKFVKVHAEKAPFLTERLKVWMLPTLAVVKNEKTTDYVVGLDDLGGREDFTTEMLAARWAKMAGNHVFLVGRGLEVLGGVERGQGGAAGRRGGGGGWAGAAGQGCGGPQPGAVAPLYDGRGAVVMQAGGGGRHLRGRAAAARGGGGGGGGGAHRAAGRGAADLGLGRGLRLRLKRAAALL